MLGGVPSREVFVFKLGILRAGEEGELVAVVVVVVVAIGEPPLGSLVAVAVYITPGSSNSSALDE